MQSVMDVESCRQELDRVLGGRAFASAERLSQFLRYVAEETLAGRADQIKEYSIGVSVYGKPADYDPKIDATVRGEASRLRSRLLEYYSAEGRDNPLRIEIPKGSYVARFVPRQEVSSQPHASVAGPSERELHQAFADRSQPGRWRGWTVFLIAACGIAVCGLAVAALISWRRASTPSAAIESLAILPFKPLGQPQQEAEQALGLVLADAVINRIGTIEGLLVRPTSAIRRYTDSGEDPVSAARQLKVAAVVEGSFQRTADRIRVTTQLLRGQDGKILWTGQFDEKLSDIFAVQDAIAEQLAAALHIQLKARGYDTTRRAREVLPEDTFELYARARYHLLRFTPDGVAKAIEGYQHLTALVPHFADAYVGLAVAYAVQPNFGLATGREVCPKIKTALDTALSLQPQLPDAIACMGTWQFWCEWNFAAAEQSFKRALQSNPAQLEVYTGYGGLLDAAGRFEEAIDIKRRALLRDPTSAAAHVMMSLSYYDLRQYDHALEWVRKAIDLDPQNQTFQLNAAAIHYAAGNYDEWAASVGRAAHLLGRTREEIVNAYQSGGRTGLLRALLPQKGDRCTGMPALGAYLHSELGDKDQAFSCLEKAYEQRDAWLLFLNVSPAWDRLRDDPRFDALLRRTGLK